MIQSRFIGVPEDIDFDDSADTTDDCQCDACKAKRETTATMEAEPEMTPSAWQRVVRMLWGGY